MELSVEGEAADIQRKPLQVLNLLLQRAGEVVRREDFILQIWRGQPTVDNVLANAITKLRNALGPTQAGWIENLPRVGYRLTGAVERTLVGEVRTAALDLQPGLPVPGREGFRLVRRLGQSPNHDVWLARQAKTTELRVYKYLANDGNPASLRREVTISRVLLTALGSRRDLVRILDWNLDAQPCFIESEYAGDNLQDWAAEDGRLAAMPRSQRLEIFLQVADAVSAAHALTVLHKDVKPANILVSPSDQTPPGWQCRLADFGSGRLLELARLGELGVTPLGLTMAAGVGSDAARGTLLYAAPELLADEPATVRSDVYSLGVLLYQLIVADFERGLHSGWERDIDDELLRADVARATDGDPARRFNSVGELTDALCSLAQRHAARAQEQQDRRTQEDLRQRLARVKARRPWVWTTFGTLATGLAVTTALLVQARATSRELALQAATVQELNRFLADDFIGAANPDITGRADVTVAEAAVKAAATINAKFRSAPGATVASIHAAMQQSLFGLSRYNDSIAAGERALTVLAAEVPRDDASPPIVNVRLALAAAHTALSQHDLAKAQLNSVDGLIKKAKLQGSEVEARYWYQHGLLAADMSRLEEAGQDQQRAWKLIQALPAADRPLRYSVALRLADANRMLGRADVAHQQFRALLKELTDYYGKMDPRTCHAQLGLASVLSYQGEPAEGLPLVRESIDCLEKTLGPDNLRTATAYQILGDLHFKLKAWPQAISAHEAFLARVSRHLNSASARILVVATNIGTARQYSGDLRGAAEVFESTLARARAAYPEADPKVQALRYRLANVKLDLRMSRGVGELLADLQPEALNRVQIAPEWDALLIYQRGRLALLDGNRQLALKLLHQAKDLLAARDAEGQINAMTAERLIARIGRGTPS